MKQLISKKRKGFTLVELLVVVAILAVLMLIALPKFKDSTKGAKIRTFEANARTLVSQVNMSYANHGADAEKIKAAEIDTKGFEGKPAGATYKVEDKGKLTCTLEGVVTKTGEKTPANYEITYNPTDGIITQKIGTGSALNATSAAEYEGVTYMGESATTTGP